MFSMTLTRKYDIIFQKVKILWCILNVNYVGVYLDSEVVCDTQKVKGVRIR